VVVAPVVCAARTALLAGAFLVEFLTRGRPVLSMLTDPPTRRPLALPGTAADLYLHAGLDAGRPLVLAHGFAPEGKDDPRVRDAAGLLARAGFDVAVPTIPGLTRGRLGSEDVEPVVGALAARDGRTVLVGVSVGAGPIVHPISRWFLASAARMACYRSYRDAASSDYMRTIGMSAQNDPVSPVEKKTFWPCAAASRKMLSSASIFPSRNGNTSHSPKEPLPALANFCATNLLNV